MKGLLKFICCIVFAFILTNGRSQVMAQKAEWITIKSTNLKCWVCKQRLEDYAMRQSDVNFESGIIEMKFNLLQGEVRIKYYPDRITPDDIKLIIVNAGFDADSLKADSSSYIKLPIQCKYITDGGGPKKGQPCHVEP